MKEEKKKREFALALAFILFSGHYELMQVQRVGAVGATRTEFVHN